MTQPSVLVVAAKWWPLSARLAIALMQHGCRVSAVCPDGHPLTHVPGVERICRYAGVFSLASVQRAIHDLKPDVIVPCDDGVVVQLHALHRLDPALRPVLERSLGAPASYPVVQSRIQLLALAKELGLRVPRTQRVSHPDELSAWHQQGGAIVVLKVDGESGGNGVRMCRSLDESLTAWQRLSVRSSYATAWKRLLIDRNPLTLWQHGEPGLPDVSVQEFIRGRPANSMMLCRDGVVLALISVAVVVAESAVGAATVVRVIDDERMRMAAERIAARLELSGFFGLDFMIDQSGEAVLIEMNPRCTQLGHFELPERGSLAGAFAASLRGEVPSRPRQPIPCQTIALFPQALAGGELCRPYLAAAHHDVPREAPELVRELELPSWPRRRWLSRLYHRWVRVPPAQPVVFDVPELDPSAPHSVSAVEPVDAV
jgi:hypothetical protein